MYVVFSGGPYYSFLMTVIKRCFTPERAGRAVLVQFRYTSVSSEIQTGINSVRRSVALPYAI